MATVHEKLIKELCFICGCILRGIVTGTVKENLEKAFNFNFDIVTPMFFAILVIAQ